MAESSQNRPDVGNILCSVYIYWDFPDDFWCNLSSNKAQDSLNCNQKHFLLLYAMQINCIYINEQVASIFSCNLRSDSELEWHFGPAFSVTPARRTLFLAARHFRAGGLICTNLKFCLVHLVTIKLLRYLTGTRREFGWRCPRCLP